MTNARFMADGGVQLLVPTATNLVGRKDRITNVVPEVDLTAVDPGRVVSRRHAQLEVEGDTYSLRDLGSTNGTFVNGRRLPPSVGCPLTEGDEISFGGVLVRFALDLAPAGSVGAPPDADADSTLAGDRTMVADGTLVLGSAQRAAGPSACVHHANSPAIGICPECMQAYCADCLGGGARMVCERCAGMLAGSPG